MEEERRHIAFCVNDEYADYIRVAILSIAESARMQSVKYTIHILSDKISPPKKELIKGSCHKINIEIVFHKIDNFKLDRLKTGKWPIHAWYRILLPEIINEAIERVLYLDADTLVLKNLSELFSMDMTNKSIAAAIDYQTLFNNAFERCSYEKEKGYICSGVILMNLRYWRENNLSGKIISWARENDDKLRCPDQDAINYICRDSKIILPMKYGIMDCFLTNPIFEENGYSEQIKECRIDPKIIHYNGCPPWYKEYKKHTYHNEWEKYNNMLEKPVRRHYQAKGILKYKIIGFKLINSFRSIFSQ